MARASDEQQPAANAHKSCFARLERHRRPHGSAMVELDAATAHALFSWFDTIVVLCTGSHCAIQLAAWPTTRCNRRGISRRSRKSMRLLTRANNHHHRVAAAHITVMAVFRESIVPHHYWSRTPSCCRNCRVLTQLGPRTMRKSQTLSTAPVNGTCCESATCLTARQMKSTAAEALCKSRWQCMQGRVRVRARAVVSSRLPRRAARVDLLEQQDQLLPNHQYPWLRHAPACLTSRSGVWDAHGVWLAAILTERRPQVGGHRRDASEYISPRALFIAGRFYQPGHGGLSRDPRARPAGMTPCVKPSIADRGVGGGGGQGEATTSAWDWLRRKEGAAGARRRRQRRRA